MQQQKASLRARRFLIFQITTDLKPIDQFRDWVFQKVHLNNLVYNTCWEDPRCDRQLLQLNEESEVAMITSAGCNALDYLLDNPGKIHCIDMNPRQNALLNLKRTFFRNAGFEDLWQVFGTGFHPRFPDFYRRKLRPHLDEFAQKYWDENLHFFNDQGLRKSFYHHSTSGTFAWLTSQYFRTRGKLYQRLQDLFNAQTLEEQSAIYLEIEGKVLNKVLEALVNRHFIMSLLGVPRSQQQLFVEKYERGAMGFIQECMLRVFTQLPIRDNYFWRLYLHGAYTPTCCPSYLEKENFDLLAQREDRIRTYTSSFSQFLKENPGTYSHFILLDHQDWLAANNLPALEEEWRLILENSRPGTRILLRSAAHEVDFFPDFVQKAVTFEQELTRITHQQDRVGTYASVYLAIVK
ncbi:MAG: hypothetical protein KIPDCIKN_00551 [Haliscomenobacter sp.]|nr:hypothetical protein [Haliscomenobacter sp.]